MDPCHGAYTWAISPAGARISFLFHHTYHSMEGFFVLNLSLGSLLALKQVNAHESGDIIGTLNTCA